jgi:hypothetical protein
MVATRGALVASRAGSRRAQADGEREGPKKVAAELQLESVGGGHTGGRRHHARVVDQQVERDAVGEDPVRELLDRGEVGQVDASDLELHRGVPLQDLGAGRLSLGDSADGHHDVRTGRGEASGGRWTSRMSLLTACAQARTCSWRLGADHVHEPDPVGGLAAPSPDAAAGDGADDSVDDASDNAPAAYEEPGGGA